MNDWKQNLPITEVVGWRRHLHQHPELSFKEFETSNFIYHVLSQFPNIKLTRPTKTSVVGILEGKQEGKTIALRADIDALAVTEEADVDFKSKNDGVMHACGHDAHTAMLLGAAKVLSEMTDELSGTVKFIFQHAEEVPPGGAKELIDLGVMENVDYVFGIHVVTGAPAGMIGLGVGAMTASSDYFELKITGRGSHGSMPETSIDAITIGAELVSNLNNIVSRNISALRNAVLSFGEFSSGEGYNAIPEIATIKGTVRATDVVTRQEIKQRIYEVSEHITKAYNGEIDIKWIDGYSAVVNDASATEIVRAAANKIVGEKAQVKAPTIMGGEDFSAYAGVTKGSYFYVGAGTAEEGCGYMAHSPKFNINEKCIVVGMQMHVQIILDLLKD